MREILWNLIWEEIGYLVVEALLLRLRSLTIQLHRLPLLLQLEHLDSCNVTLIIQTYVTKIQDECLNGWPAVDLGGHIPRIFFPISWGFSEEVADYSVAPPPCGSIFIVNVTCYNLL